jgi:hypothetical protein
VRAANSAEVAERAVEAERVADADQGDARSAAEVAQHAPHELVQLGLVDRGHGVALPTPPGGTGGPDHVDFLLMPVLATGRKRWR